MVLGKKNLTIDIIKFSLLLTLELGLVHRIMTIQGVKATASSPVPVSTFFHIYASVVKHI